MAKAQKFSMFSLLLRILPGLIIGLSVGILVPLFQYPIQQYQQQYQNTPKIMFEIQSPEYPEVCPKTVNFGNSLNANFNINYKNSGKATAQITITLDSGKVKSRIEGTTDPYVNTTMRTMDIEPGTSENFKFRLKRDGNLIMSNMTFLVNERCGYTNVFNNNLSCGGLVACCNYRVIKDTNNLVLSDDKCPQTALPVAAPEPEKEFAFSQFFEKINTQLEASRRWAFYQ